jgi:hypothetical protein
MSRNIKFKYNKMKKVTISFGAILFALFIFTSCNEHNSKEPNAKTVPDPTAPEVENTTTPVPDPTTAAESSSQYDFMSKISGTYKIISNRPDYIPESVAIKVSEKNIIIDKTKYNFVIEYNKNDTLIQFSSISEETGDFLGGGTILFNGSKIQYKMLFGTEAGEEYIFEKTGR